MAKDRVGIIFGGRSGEYEVSQNSSASVFRAIDKEKHEITLIGITKKGEWKLYEGAPENMENGTWVEQAKDFNPWDMKGMIDFALPIVHGPYCEDGKLQGLLEMLDIPYGGCGVLASALAMDKLVAKDVFKKNGLPVCKHVGVFFYQYTEDKDAVFEEIEKELGYPVFVKPCNMGSSVGISKAHNRKELEEAITFAFKYDRRLIVEEFINCREVETGILGNEHPKAAAVGEIIPMTEFYDYNSKYIDSATRIQIPAELPEETYEEIRRLAVKAYAAIDGEGFSRCDFFVDKETGKIYLNEINTIPGCTRTSIFPMLWKAAGLEYKDTIERIIELGYERYNAKNSR